LVHVVYSLQFNLRSVDVFINYMYALLSFVQNVVVFLFNVCICLIQPTGWPPHFSKYML